MEQRKEDLTLVTRKPCFGLPTACPSCLPVFIYLKLANIPFHLDFNSTFPDSDQIPYVESGTYVAYNNEKGGVIESLREDGIIDLDSQLHSISDFVAMKAMLCSWLEDAVAYELWLGSDGSSAHQIYYSDLPWPLGKILYLKQIHVVKQQLGIAKDNTERREAEIYRRANVAYGALSSRLGEDDFFYDNRPSSLDAIFLGHALFVIQALSETSSLRGKLLEHGNLIRYAEKHKIQLLETGPTSSSVHQFPPSTSSSFAHRHSDRSSKAKSKPKREKTEEEKTFRRRAKYFLAAQFIAVLFYLTIMGRSDDAEMEFGEDDEDLDYNG